MTPSNLETALRSFARRRPFRPFWLEFFSGDRVQVTHPEVVVERVGNLFVFRGPNRANRVFAADSVCQLLEEPAETS